MKFRALLLALALASLAPAAHAQVTFEIDADWVTIGSNTGIPDGNVFFLVADTANNGFNMPTLGHFTAGNLWGQSADDIVLVSFAANGGSNFGTAGVQQTVISNLIYSSFTNATVAAGDHVGLFWFPSIAYNATSTFITGNTGFGYFDTGSSGSDAASWVLPADLTSDKAFTFATSNAQIFSSGNDVATFAATVPEPSTFALLGSLTALGYACWRRRATA